MNQDDETTFNNLAFAIRNGNFEGFLSIFQEAKKERMNDVTKLLEKKELVRNKKNFFFQDYKSIFSKLKRMIGMEISTHSCIWHVLRE